MSVPEEIRKVPRPVNTIVVDTGHDGPNRYIVRVRKGSVCRRGKRPSPRNGAVVGHIVGESFVPVVKKTPAQKPCSLSYGSSFLIFTVCKDILDDLLKVYSPEDSYSLLVLAAIKVMKPHAPLSRYRRYYDCSFLSVYYPGARISKNRITSLLDSVGKDSESRKKFYALRIAAVAEANRIAIDGTLRQDGSTVNDLSHFSRKARVKGTRDVSIIYAYSLDLKEPLCAEVFAGNETDTQVYEKFITENGIKAGIIMADKAFTPSKIEKELAKHAGLHFLTPLKRNNAKIEKCDMYAYDSILEGFSDRILCKKAAEGNGRFLYSFMNQRKAAEEEKAYLSSVDGYDDAEYKKKRKEFRTIVFESDADLDPKDVYRQYRDRWQIEIVFRAYKNELGLDKTNVQGDFTVIGYELVNFIATLISCRILNKAGDAGALDDEAFGGLIEDLNEVWRKTDAPSEATMQDDGWERALEKDLDLLVKLGLAKDASVKRPRGRPRKYPKVEKPKRPVGRPRKHPAIVQ